MVVEFADVVLAVAAHAHGEGPEDEVVDGALLHKVVKGEAVGVHLLLALLLVVHAAASNVVGEAVDDGLQDGAILIALE